MLYCVYTVINKLGLAGPEASLTPAQTVPCDQTLFCIQTLLNSFIKVSSRCQVIPHPCVTVVTLSSLLWLVSPLCDWTMLLLWLCCSWALLLWLWGRRRRLAETFSSSGVWAEERERERERDYRQLHWYTLRARRGLGIRASHWSPSACCGLSLARSVMSVFISEGLSLGPSLRWAQYPHSAGHQSHFRELRRGAVTMMHPDYPILKKNSFKFSTKSIFPFLDISCYRY